MYILVRKHVMKVDFKALAKGFKGLRVTQIDSETTPPPCPAALITEQDAIIIGEGGFCLELESA